MSIKLASLLLEMEREGPTWYLPTAWYIDNQVGSGLSPFTSRLPRNFGGTLSSVVSDKHLPLLPIPASSISKKTSIWSCTSQVRLSATSPWEVSFHLRGLSSFMPSTDILHRKGPDSHTSESVGKVKDVLTEPGHQAGRNVNASPENPRYEVCSVVLPESSWPLSGLIIGSDNDVYGV
nr:hypothetical protein B3E4.280 [imported] - Neurospora crassa [Neurospora crassa]